VILFVTPINLRASSKNSFTAMIDTLRYYLLLLQFTVKHKFLTGSGFLMGNSCGYFFSTNSAALYPDTLAALHSSYRQISIRQIMTVNQTEKPVSQFIHKSVSQPIKQSITPIKPPIIINQSINQLIN